MAETLIESLGELQETSRRIAAPKNSGILPARGGLRGPGFFPEGLGLSLSTLRSGERPQVMVVGHNFGCEDYRCEIDHASREDDRQTWANLDRLLLGAGINPGQVFRTNWFVGLIQGDRQVGKFLKRKSPAYEAACQNLLIRQIALIRPRTVLLLGVEVARRFPQIAPSLACWSSARRWADIDRSRVGHSMQNVLIQTIGIEVDVACLLHPSLAAANEGRRMRGMPTPMREVDIVKAISSPR